MRTQNRFCVLAEIIMKHSSSIDNAVKVNTRVCILTGAAASSDTVKTVSKWLQLTLPRQNQQQHRDESLLCYFTSTADMHPAGPGQQLLQRSSATCVMVPDYALMHVLDLLWFVRWLQEWVERYRSNRAAAAAELMTLLVKVGTSGSSMLRSDSSSTCQQQQLS